MDGENFNRLKFLAWSKSLSSLTVAPSCKSTPMDQQTEPTPVSKARPSNWAARRRKNSTTFFGAPTISNKSMASDELTQSALINEIHPLLAQRPPRHLGLARRDRRYADPRRPRGRGVEDPAQSTKASSSRAVIEAKPHPNADRLRVCIVDAGGGPVQVVCGAPNARTGMKSVFSPVGTYIPGKKLTLAKGVIRGVESNGMLCSAAELELSDDHDGIIELARRRAGRRRLRELRRARRSRHRRRRDARTVPTRPASPASRAISPPRGSAS